MSKCYAPFALHCMPDARRSGEHARDLPTTGLSIKSHIVVNAALGRASTQHPMSHSVPLAGTPASPTLDYPWCHPATVAQPCTHDNEPSRSTDRSRRWPAQEPFHGDRRLDRPPSVCAGLSVETPETGVIARLLQGLRAGGARSLSSSGKPRRRRVPRSSTMRRGSRRAQVGSLSHCATVVPVTTVSGSKDRSPGSSSAPR